jgi:hypothetical protein
MCLSSSLMTCPLRNTSELLQLFSQEYWPLYHLTSTIPSVSLQFRVLSTTSSAALFLFSAHHHIRLHFITHSEKHRRAFGRAFFFDNAASYGDFCHQRLFALPCSFWPASAWCFTLHAAGILCLVQYYIPQLEMNRT